MTASCREGVVLWATPLPWQRASGGADLCEGHGLRGGTGRAGCAAAAYEGSRGTGQGGMTMGAAMSRAGAQAGKLVNQASPT